MVSRRNLDIVSRGPSQHQLQHCALKWRESSRRRSHLQASTSSSWILCPLAGYTAATDSLLAHTTRDERPRTCSIPTYHKQKRVLSHFPLGRSSAGRYLPLQSADSLAGRSPASAASGVTRQKSSGSQPCKGRTDEVVRHKAVIPKRRLRP
jgi:hypothetical protein